MNLAEDEPFALGDDAPPWLAMAMRIVVEAARMLGAGSLAPVGSVRVGAGGEVRLTAPAR